MISSELYQHLKLLSLLTEELISSASPTTFTPAWCAQHLPLIDAAMDLLEADDVEFARRCRLMRDEEGRAMLDELARQLQRLGAHIADVADALGLTAEQTRAVMNAESTPVRGS